jgi:hypothetical protein
MFKKLKGIFIEDDGSTIGSPSRDEGTVFTDENKIPSNTNKPSSNPEISFDPKTLDGKAPDQKFVEILLKAIEDNNMEGFDYLEFKSSLQSLSKVSMDAATRYQSAMAMSKTMGASPEKIMSSANHYLDILKAENDKFQQAVSAQKSKVSSDQTNGIKQYQDSIVMKQKQIEQLSKEIEESKAALKKLQDDISNNANKISETSAKFDQAFKLVTQQILDDIKNIKSFASNV